MKFALLLLLICCCLPGFSQTQIQSTTTIQSVGAMPSGKYYYTVSKDTFDFAKDSPLICRPTSPCPPVDSAGIIKAYIAAHPCPACPPPIICPVCPPPAKQRKVVKRTTVHTAGVDVDTYLYDDGSTSGL